MNNICNICERKIFRISKIETYNSNQNFNWEHDSIFELLNLENSEVYSAFCTNCFHSRLFPSFSNQKLYLKGSGFEIRKKHFEKYNPNQKYDDYEKIISKENIFKITVEAQRLNKYANVIAKEFLNNHFLKNKRSIKILDYGGGDGYISKSVKVILEALFNIQIKVDIYNPTSLDLKNESRTIQSKYDIIILSHVLEHIHFLKEFIDEVMQYAHTETKLIIEVPDERLKILKTFFRIRKNFMEVHVNYFSKFAIYNLFKRFQLFGNIDYMSSSYRGQKMMTIFSIMSRGQPKNCSKIFEFYYLISYIFRIISSKFFSNFKK